MTTQSDANAPGRQVDGDHYKSKYQHWDLAADLDLGYFEGQITKYIVRHRQKAGKKDVEKCQHFLEKLIELATEGRAAWPGRLRLDAGNIQQFFFERQKAGAPTLTTDERIVFDTGLYWRGTEVLHAALEACKRVVATYP
jgi:hypothetical protein